MTQPPTLHATPPCFFGKALRPHSSALLAGTLLAFMSNLTCDDFDIATGLYIPSSSPTSNLVASRASEHELYAASDNIRHEVSAPAFVAGGGLAGLTVDYIELDGGRATPRPPLTGR